VGSREKVCYFQLAWQETCPDRLSLGRQAEIKELRV
jgi:hypothetical protein